MNHWLRKQLEEEHLRRLEEESDADTAVLDKIEAARCSYDPWPLASSRDMDTRQDQSSGQRDNFLGVLTDKDDGMLGMLYEIRDMIFPAIEQEQQQVNYDQTTTRSTTTQDSVIPDWQLNTTEQFMSAWHHVEVSTAARMLATDEHDASMLAMFREIGQATYDELSSGSEQLSDFVLVNMRIALEMAQRFGNNVSLLTDAVLVPKERPALTNKPFGDVSMAGMFKAEEWS